MPAVRQRNRSEEIYCDNVGSNMMFFSNRSTLNPARPR